MSIVEQSGSKGIEKKIHSHDFVDCSVCVKRLCLAVYFLTIPCSSVYCVETWQRVDLTVYRYTT